VRKEVHAILADRPAEGSADLLIGVREHPLLNEIRGVEPAIAEIARERSGKVVGARLRYGVHLNAARASLCRVKSIGDELELRDRIAAVARLSERRGVDLRNLLAIEIDLERSRTGRGKIAGCHLSASLGEHREVRP